MTDFKRLLCISLLSMLFISEVSAQWGPDPFYWWGPGMSPRHYWWRMYRRAMDREMLFGDYGNPWWRGWSSSEPWGPNRGRFWSDGQWGQGSPNSNNGNWGQGFQSDQNSNNGNWNQRNNWNSQGQNGPQSPPIKTTTTTTQAPSPPGPPGI